MQTLAVGDFTYDQVKRELHRSGRKVKFRYDVLTKTNAYKAPMSKVTKASVQHNSLAEVKRTLKLSALEGDNIDWDADRIRPWFQLKMPGGVWVEWPLGLFLINSPGVDVRPTGRTREIDAFDQGLIVKDDAFDTPYVVESGDLIVDHMREILESAGIINHRITESSLVALVDIEWEVAVSKLTIFNALAQGVNYWSLSFDGLGVALSSPYVRPDERDPEYTYGVGPDSVMSPTAKLTADISAVPNKWVGYVSEADRPPLRSVYTNENPLSRTSTVSRGRTKVEKIQISGTVPDQTTLDAAVQRAAAERSQIFENFEFTTAIMPHHTDSDMLGINFTGANIENGKFVEHTWEMELGVGTLMKHNVRRVVPV